VSKLLIIAASVLANAERATGQSATPPQAINSADADLAARQCVVVVSASRREEELLNAPATMTVLSDTFLKNAPSQEMVDLLRSVPGMNTAQTSARDLNVTSRAATGTLSDSMLVLPMDDRFYQDFFGFVMWDFVRCDERNENRSR